MRRFDVTHDQDEFHREKELVDWGVLVCEKVGGDVQVCVVALKPEEAAKLLRGAADAIEVAA